MSHLSEDRFDQLVSEERARDAAPLNTWESIARRAREEGLIYERAAGKWPLSPWMRAAAGVLILAGGIGIGRYTNKGPGAADSGAVAETPVTQAATPASFNSVDEAWATLDRASADYQ